MDTPPPSVCSTSGLPSVGRTAATRSPSVPTASPASGCRDTPPAQRPAVEAVDGRAEVGLEAVQAELGDVGDAEQAGLGGVEAVRPVPAEGQVRRPLAALPGVAAVPSPPAHLERLAGHESLLAHHPAHLCFVNTI